MKTVTLCRPGIMENALCEFDRAMDSFFGNSFLTPSERIFNPVFASGFPRVDVRETEKAYVLEAELPGYDEKEIEVHLENNTLTISSKKEEIVETKDSAGTNDSREEKKDEGYLIRERRSSSFSRSFKLPENADSEGIKAAFKNGILSLDISKKAEAAKKLIQISTD